MVDESLIIQYIQHPQTAKDFANYLELYRKYKKEYKIQEILEGGCEIEPVESLKQAQFDEKISVVNLFIGRLSESFQKAYLEDGIVTKLYEQLKEIKSDMETKDLLPLSIITECLRKQEEQYQQEKMAGLLNTDEKKIQQIVLERLMYYAQRINEERFVDGTFAFAALKEWFQESVEKRQRVLEQAAQELKRAFRFLEQNFGESQEMVIFVTELTAHYYSVWFLSNCPSEEYNYYSKHLLLSQEKKEIQREISLQLLGKGV